MATDTREDLISQAQDTAEVIQADFNLDFSLESLERVDELLGNLGDCGDELSGRAAYMFGCYVGEVLVRQAGAAWAVQDDMNELFGWPLMLHAGPVAASPFVRCYRRLEDDGDSVAIWGQLVVAAASHRFDKEAAEGGSDEQADSPAGTT